ncbi:hypothetical protein B0H17DRAFT_634062 [Mycena rosella]|uniref:Uncharacterized protein n=1 Tax=Mycena rosella TaxID=1033263 RepID=A0AAD7GII8_MYCRO|nr:hypothetical protein B0H17DRAFT_634062 [Mycena rosella]
MISIDLDSGWDLCDDAVMTEAQVAVNTNTGTGGQATAAWDCGRDGHEAGAWRWAGARCIGGGRPWPSRSSPRTGGEAGRVESSLVSPARLEASDFAPAQSLIHHCQRVVASPSFPFVVASPSFPHRLHLPVASPAFICSSPPSFASSFASPFPPAYHLERSPGRLGSAPVSTSPPCTDNRPSPGRIFGAFSRRRGFLPWILDLVRSVARPVDAHDRD